MYDSPCLFQNTMNANILQEKMDRKWNVKKHMPYITMAEKIVTMQLENI